MGTWPIQLNETFKPPECLSIGEKYFKMYYDSRNSKRVLKWAYTKSYVQLIANFTRQRLLEGTTFQAAILLLYNEADILTLGTQIINY